MEEREEKRARREELEKMMAERREREEQKKRGKDERQRAKECARARRASQLEKAYSCIRKRAAEVREAERKLQEERLGQHKVGGKSVGAVHGREGMDETRGIAEGKQEEARSVEIEEGGGVLQHGKGPEVEGREEGEKMGGGQAVEGCDESADELPHGLPDVGRSPQLDSASHSRGPAQDSESLVGRFESHRGPLNESCADEDALLGSGMWGSFFQTERSAGSGGHPEEAPFLSVGGWEQADQPHPSDSWDGGWCRGQDAENWKPRTKSPPASPQHSLGADGHARVSQMVVEIAHVRLLYLEDPSNPSSARNSTHLTVSAFTPRHELHVDALFAEPLAHGWLLALNSLCAKSGRSASQPLSLTVDDPLSLSVSMDVLELLTKRRGPCGCDCLSSGRESPAAHIPTLMEVCVGPSCPSSIGVWGSESLSSSFYSTAGMHAAVQAVNLECRLHIPPTVDSAAAGANSAAPFVRQLQLDLVSGRVSVDPGLNPPALRHAMSLLSAILPPSVASPVLYMETLLSSPSPGAWSVASSQGRPDNGLEDLDARLIISELESIATRNSASVSANPLRSSVVVDSGCQLVSLRTDRICARMHAGCSRASLELVADGLACDAWLSVSPECWKSVAGQGGSLSVRADVRYDSFSVSVMTHRTRGADEEDSDSADDPPRGVRTHVSESHITRTVRLASAEEGGLVELTWNGFSKQSVATRAVLASHAGQGAVRTHMGEGAPHWDDDVFSSVFFDGGLGGSPQHDSAFLFTPSAPAAAAPATPMSAAGGGGGTPHRSKPAALLVHLQCDKVFATCAGLPSDVLARLWERARRALQHLTGWRGPEVHEFDMAQLTVVMQKCVLSGGVDSHPFSEQLASPAPSPPPSLATPPSPAPPLPSKSRVCVAFEETHVSVEVGDALRMCLQNNSFSVGRVQVDMGGDAASEGFVPLVSKQARRCHPVGLDVDHTIAISCHGKQVEIHVDLQNIIFHAIRNRQETADPQCALTRVASALLAPLLPFMHCSGVLLVHATVDIKNCAVSFSSHSRPHARVLLCFPEAKASCDLAGDADPPPRPACDSVVSALVLSCAPFVPTRLHLQLPAWLALACSREADTATSASMESDLPVGDLAVPAWRDAVVREWRGHGYVVLGEGQRCEALLACKLGTPATLRLQLHPVATLLLAPDTLELLLALAIEFARPAQPRSSSPSPSSKPGSPLFSVSPVGLKGAPPQPQKPEARVYATMADVDMSFFADKRKKGAAAQPLSSPARAVQPSESDFSISPILADAGVDAPDGLQAARQPPTPPDVPSDMLLPPSQPTDALAASDKFAGRGEMPTIRGSTASIAIIDNYNEVQPGSAPDSHAIPAHYPPSCNRLLVDVAALVVVLRTENDFTPSAPRPDPSATVFSSTSSVGVARMRGAVQPRPHPPSAPLIARPEGASAAPPRPACHHLEVRLQGVLYQHDWFVAGECSPHLHRRRLTVQGASVVDVSTPPASTDGTQADWRSLLVPYWNTAASTLASVLGPTLMLTGNNDPMSASAGADKGASASGVPPAGGGASTSTGPTGREPPAATGARTVLFSFDTEYAVVRENSEPLVDIVCSATRVAAALFDQRVKIRVLPVRLRIQQGTLEFLFALFGRLDTFVDSLGGHSLSPAPFFSPIHVSAVKVRLDYVPYSVNIDRIRQLSDQWWFELFNLLPAEGARIEFEPVEIRSAQGVGGIVREILSAWQRTGVLTLALGYVRNMAYIRQAVALTAGLSDLVTIPIRQYLQHGQLVSGIVEGTTSFARHVWGDSRGMQRQGDFDDFEKL